MAVGLASFASFACGADSKPASKGEDSADVVQTSGTAGAVTNLTVIRRYLEVYSSKDFDGVRALFADDFREWPGSKFNGTVARAERLDQMVKSWKGENLWKPQVVLTDDTHALILTLAQARAASGTSAPYAQAVALDLKGGKIRRRSLWFDQMTVFHSFGVPRSAGGPTREEAWTNSPIEVAASGDEREATEIARVGELIEAISARDHQRAASLVAPGFVDRDFSKPAGNTYASADEFADALKGWIGRSEIAITRALDVWSAGRFAVAHISRSERSNTDVHLYMLWVFEFEPSGKIARRWQFRDRLAEKVQRGEIDPNEYGRSIQQTLSRKPPPPPPPP